MKKTILLIFGLICLFTASRGDVEIRCKQEISVVGKTEGEYSILFYHTDWKKGRHCGISIMHIIFLTREGAYALDRKSAGPVWAENYLNDLGADSSISIKKSDGRYYLNDSVYFEPAPKDTTFSARFWQLPKNNAVTWNWEYGPEDGCDPPLIHGARWKMLYTHDEGVYKNYMIREVYYFPKSNYIVIKTLQPQLDETNKTMDGLMVFYLNP